MIKTYPKWLPGFLFLLCIIALCVWQLGGNDAFLMRMYDSQAFSVIEKIMITFVIIGGNILAPITVIGRIFKSPTK
jgi:hypothetical protein